MKRYISCFFIVLLLFINITSYSTYASQEDNTPISSITINICNYEEDIPYSCVAILQDNTLYLKGEDISRITKYSYWGDSLINTADDKYGELFSQSPDDSYTSFRSVSTVFYNPRASKIRSLGYEYDYHHLSFEDTFYFPFEKTMYLLHCQWCIDEGVLYVRTLGDNVIDFVLRHGVDMMNEQPTRGDLLVEGENNVVKTIAEMAHSYDSRLFIIGWGLNNKIEEDFENALLAYNLPDIDFLNDFNTESTSEMVEVFENDFDKLATVVGAGGNIDEKINIIRKAMSKSPKGKMNKWNDVSLFKIPELEQAGKVLEGVNDVFKILDYGMKMYELSTRSSGWNRDFLSEIKLISEQDEKSLGISLTNEGQNVINAAKNIWNQYKGDNKIVDDYSVISGGGLIADKIFDMTPESLLVKGVQLANAAMEISNKDYKNTMDAYGLEFDAKYADRVTNIALLIFNRHLQQLYQFGTSNNDTKLSKKFIQDLYTSTELYLRASFRQSIYVYEVKRMLSKEDDWENSAEGISWKNRINKYQKLLTELNYTTFYNSDHEKNYYEKLLLIDNVDNYYSDEYGCMRIRLTEEDIKSLEITAEPTNTNEENFDEKDLRNMDLIAESVIYHCIDDEIDSWNPDISNLEYYWDVMCFYSNFSSYNEDSTLNYSQKEDYYIVPDQVLKNVSFACFKDFNGIIPHIDTDIWRAAYNDSNSKLLIIGDSGIKDFKLESYTCNEDNSVDAIYSVLFWGDEEDESADYYKIHYILNPHDKGAGQETIYHFTVDSVSILNNIDTIGEETQEDLLQWNEAALTGWAGAGRLATLKYDDAEQGLEYLLQTYGKGKVAVKGTYEIVSDFDKWEEGDSYSSSFSMSSHAFRTENQSDLGLLYAASGDYNGDGIADIISFRTEEEMDENGGSWIYWYGQLDLCGKNSSSFIFCDLMNNESGVFFIVVDHYLIKVVNIYEGGNVWPISEKEVDDYDLTFYETIEVQDLDDSGEIVFSSTREVGNYFPDDYNYQLEIPGNRYYWNLNYSTSDNVALHEISDESEILAIIEEKLEDLVGEPVLTLSPLRWDNRWSAITFSNPASVLQIKMSVEPADIEEMEADKKKVGSGSFSIRTSVPSGSIE